MSFMPKVHSEGSLDRELVREYHRDVAKLQQDLVQLAEVSKLVGVYFSQHEERLNVIEKQVENAVHDVDQSALILNEVVKEKGTSRRLILSVGLGGVAGGALGAVGFAVNPLVGVVALLIFSGIGAGTGAAVHAFK